MANPVAITPHASAAESGSGVGSSVDLGTSRTCARLRLELTAISGTGARLTVALQTSDSGAGSWESLPEAFAPLTVPGTVDLTVAPCRRFLRVSWTLEGAGPSATFALAGQAHQLYAEPADIVRFALPAVALANVSQHEQADACLRATGDVEWGLSGSFTLPLVSWDDTLRGRCADIAAYYALKRRGFNPEGKDKIIVDAYTAAMKWLGDIADGKGLPPAVVDSSPTLDETEVFIYTEPTRGW